MGIKFHTEIRDPVSPLGADEVVGERSNSSEVVSVRSDGAVGSENAGMSSVI